MAGVSYNAVCAFSLLPLSPFCHLLAPLPLLLDDVIYEQHLNNEGSNKYSQVKTSDPEKIKFIDQYSNADNKSNSNSWNILSWKKVLS